MNSSMIATEPISDDVWETIGWRGCETRRRTPRTASSTPSAPSTTASRSAAAVCRTATVRAPMSKGGFPSARSTHLTATLREVLPQIRDVPIAHGWCGVLAVPRDWSAGVALDKSTGLGWAGGYVGHGVTATNLAGRTLADLVLDQPETVDRIAVGGPPVAATGSPSRCAGWVCAECIWRTSWPTGTKREAGRPPRRSPSSPTRSQAGPSALRLFGRVPQRGSLPRRLIVTRPRPSP